MAIKIIRTKYLRRGNLEVLINGEIKNTLTVLENGHYRIGNDENSRELLGKDATKIPFRNVNQMKNYVLSVVKGKYQKTLISMVINKPPINIEYNQSLRKRL